MTVTAKIDARGLADFERAVAEQIQQAKVQAENAMLAAFYGVVDANFGPLGLDRPWEWAELSKSKRGLAYQLKVGRSYATLYETGAMHAAIHKEPSTGDGAYVSMDDSDVGYSLRHHYGSPADNLPARRVFPIQADGEVTTYTQAVVEYAAREAFMEALS